MVNLTSRMERIMIIPQANPKAWYLKRKEIYERAILRVIERGIFILGPEVEEFEKGFSSYTGARFSIGVASGTDALILSLKVLGIGMGDGVITVSHTAVATVAAIDLVGARPIVVDVDPETFTMDMKCLEEAINSISREYHHSKWRIKAIIPVHLYGNPADMDRIIELARQAGLKVIEDCCQAHGASLNGKMVGRWGDISAFSFYPTKNLGCLGDGGMVITDDPDLADKIRMLRQYGWRKKGVSEIPGANSRLDEIQASILRERLSFLDEENDRRRRIANIYRKAIEGTGLKASMERPGAFNVYHQFVVRSKRRKELIDFLRQRGISTAIHYPIPVHLQPAYRGRVEVSGEMKCTEDIAREVLSLPVYPELTDEEVEYIAETISGWKEKA
jgi:dTDP-4-amino-4,6-dideoxygalactose transaminase